MSLLMCNCCMEQQDEVGEHILREMPHLSEFHAPPATTGADTVTRSTPVIVVHQAAEQAASAAKVDTPWTVSIMAAKGLRSSDWVADKAKSDCYCTCEWNGDVLAKTISVPNELEPSWTVEQEVKGSTLGASLEFKVWDQEHGKADQLLGTATLEGAKWDSLGFHGELKLHGTGVVSAEAALAVKIRLPGMDYPEGPIVEYTVVLEKEAGQSLGLHLDGSDSQTVQVTKIGEGLVSAYNASAPPEKLVSVGDFIVSANGNSGSESILKTLRSEQTLELVVKKGVEFSVVVSKTGGMLRIGTGLVPEGVSVTVLEILDGLLAAWNKANPHRLVNVGDRISAVCYRRELAPQLLELLKKEAQLHLLICRPTSAAKKWWWS